MPTPSLRPLHALAAVAAFTACQAHDERPFTAQSVQLPGLAIQTQGIAYSDRRQQQLRVELMVQNSGPAFVEVSRHDITLALPNGRRLSPFGGRRPLVIAPGTAASVDVLYGNGSYVLGRVASLEIHFENAFTVNGAPIAVPPVPVSH